MSYARYEEFIAQAPFMFRGQWYDFNHPLRLYEIRHQPPLPGSHWVSQYHGTEIAIRNSDVHRVPGDQLGTRAFDLLICEDSEVVFHGFYILNFGMMSSVWLLSYQVRCLHEFMTRHHRRQQQREIFFTGPMWPIIQFHVVEPRTQERMDLVYRVPSRRLTFGSLRDRTLEGFMVTYMTTVPIQARQEMPLFERALEMIQHPNDMAVVQDQADPPEANHNETLGGL